MVNAAPIVKYQCKSKEDYYPRKITVRIIMLRCPMDKRYTRRRCSAEFRRPWNLKRHIEDVHSEGASPVDHSAASPPNKAPIAPMMHTAHVKGDTYETHLPPTDEVNSDRGLFEMVPGPGTTRDSGDGQKRKRSVVDVDGGGYDRIAHARLDPPMPSYKPQLSTQIPNQMKGIEWLSNKAKGLFEEELTFRLAQWGVDRSHKGTCVLVPEDWKSLDPMDLLPIFDIENSPTAQAARLRYNHADHGTAFARAKVWFDQWPRSGLELDNFCGKGPFKPMDASHECHQNLCISHLCYEPSNKNHDRKQCCEMAHELRKDGKEIPEKCEIHDPPCLLQLAVLTTSEALSIQFHVLKMARGVSTTKPRRPRRHRWSTFEGALPCNYSSIKVDPNALVGIPPRQKPEGKPNLFCKYCTKIKNFDSISGLWGHLVHKHDGIDTSMRLDEIRRTASKWRTFWKRYSDGGKRGCKTKERLTQVQQEGFCWDDVLDWELR